MTFTCVSGYFPVKNKHGNKYLDWFKRTLSIDCPYVFFTNKENIDVIKKFREGYQTHYIVCEIEDMYAYKYKNDFFCHPRHMPSQELGVIWNEKIFMIQKASQINPFNSEWFMWIDAGLCNFRERPPPNKKFPNMDLVKHLPKDKFIYSSSTKYDASLVTYIDYYHHISGTFILHKNIIDLYANIYKVYMDKLIKIKSVWTEQVIYTHIYKNHPELYYMLSDGYGAIISYLYR
jgi:hypothetical protein